MIPWRKITSMFKRPTEAKRERWLRMKAGGKRRFVLRLGVLQWGGLMFLGMTAGDLIRKPPFPRQPIDYIVEIAIGLMVWPFAGLLFGLAMWSFYESYFSDANSGHPKSGA